MTNDEVYATGLLIRALDPATQPPEIRAFLSAELELLSGIVRPGTRMIDIGCGTGRHLAFLGDRLGLGIGVDYEFAYILEAQRRITNANLFFITADATAVPLRTAFDLATCLTNTWGTMRNPIGVLDEMRRLAPLPHSRLLSVFSQTSIPARREWYRRFGHEVREETADFLLTEGGLRSEHFSDARLRTIIGDCDIRPLGDVAYAVRF